MLPKINKKSATPSYIQIKEHFQSLIENNILKAGDRIPSEQELVQTTKLSRMTVRQGMQQLVQLGYLRTKQGLGTFVVGQVSELDSLNFCSLHKEFQEYHKNSPHKMMRLETQEAPEDIAKKLELNTGELVWVSESIRYVDDLPAVYEISHLPQSIFPRCEEKHLLNNKYSWVQLESSQSILYSKKRLYPINTDKTLAHILSTTENTPIIKMDMTVFLDDHTPCEHTTLYFHPEYPLNIVQLFKD